MPTTLGRIVRRRLARHGIGMPGDNSHILAVARRLRAVEGLVDVVRAGQGDRPAGPRF